MISWLRSCVSSFIELVYELKKECLRARYPGRQEIAAHVIAVVIGAAVIAAFIFCVDILAKVFLGQLLL